MTIEIYTDGACFENPGPGGCATILVDAENKKEVARIVKRYRYTNPERLEILGIIDGLRVAKSLKDVEKIDIFPLRLETERRLRSRISGSEKDLWGDMFTEISELKENGIPVEVWHPSFKNPYFKKETSHLAYDIIDAEDKNDIDYAYEIKSHYDPCGEMKTERVRQRIKDIFSILLESINANDLSDVPDKLSKRIIEMDIRTQKAFKDFLNCLTDEKSVPIGDTGIRICTSCGKLMVEGYYLRGDYACCQSCGVNSFAGYDWRGKKMPFDVAEKIFQKKLENPDPNDDEGCRYQEWEIKKRKGK